MTTMTAANALARPGTGTPVELDGAVRQGGITVVTPIVPGRTADLRALLNSIDRDDVRGTDVESNGIIPFMELTRVHFARWLILEDAPDVSGRIIPATLIFSSNYDEPLKDHLDELVAVAGSGLDMIYAHCVGYPPMGHSNPAAVTAYLRAHCVDVNTFYNGTYGKSVDQIRREASLHAAIGEFLDGRMAETRGTREDPAAVRHAVQQFVRGRPDLAWALRPPRPTRPPFPGVTFAVVVLIALGIALVVSAVMAPMATLKVVSYAAGGLLLPAAVWLLLIRIHESRDDATAWTEKHRPKKPDLARREDRVVQNQLSSVIDIRPGMLRALTLRTVLGAINLAARYLFYKGKLGSIPSIHFARWVIVDDGRRLAFFSNFDGSWESYLGEFVDRASSGLTAVWSNCVEFPRTRWLIHQGAANEQAFKSYAREKQVVTNVWYSAYKTLTVLNITNNSEIRRGLTGSLTAAELATWLRRL